MWVHMGILILILGVGLFLFYYATGNQMLQLFAGLITVISYVLWGLIYHSHKGDLHKNIVVEYLLIGAIAIVLLITLAI